MTERPRRATIKELAERTGLSPAAVSYALRGVQVSAETVERVREAADEIGYRADPIAQALRGGETGTVGLIVGALSDYWNQELVAALQRRLRASERHLLIADAGGDPLRETELALGLVDRRVDGLIAAPIGPIGEGWAQIAAAVPTVAIGEALPEAATAGEIVFDHERGLLQLLGHLASLGHSAVTVLSWALEAAPGRSVERAVVSAADEIGLEVELVPCPYSLDGAHDLACDLLAVRAAPVRAALPDRLDRLRRLRGVPRSRPLGARRRLGRRLRRPPALAARLTAPDERGLGDRGHRRDRARDAAGGARGPQPVGAHDPAGPAARPRVHGPGSGLISSRGPPRSMGEAWSMPNPGCS